MTVGKYIVKLLAISQTVRFSIFNTTNNSNIFITSETQTTRKAILLWMDRNNKKLTWLLLLLL